MVNEILDFLFSSTDSSLISRDYKPLWTFAYLCPLQICNLNYALRRGPEEG